ncbi:major facilitator superfamily domain-containing protein [Rhypophila decipiens]|uniref:Major facilitator superfamily domain-containing protein n=1 Tax=Rhypophila decipiens TaxID=261697 RepID=A0AAN6XYA4_9PEZI|nr:major facilitator superfamily domain-containing protein [Rhypophila decipiens]
MFSCLDTSIVSTALVSISKDLGSDEDATWTILGYLLTYMSFAVCFSKLSDIYGRKHLLAAAWVFFSGFSIMCAGAANMTQLILGRALQGIGGAGLYSLAQICLLEQGPNRPEIVGALVGVTLSISYVLGPLLGGMIAAWHWTGIFWLNLPFGILAIIGIYTLWPEERHGKFDARTAFRKIDFIGNTLLILGSILLVLALEQGGTSVWKWASSVTIWSLVISGIAWVLLCVWETYLFFGRGDLKIEPIFPLNLAVGRVYFSCLIVTFFTGFIYVALVIKIPERLQVMYGETSVWAGIHLLPMLGSCAVGSTLGGAISKKKNLTSQTLVLATFIQVLGLGLLYGVSSPDPQTEKRYLFGFTAIYGLGIGLCFAACTMIAGIEARNDDLATAQGAVAQARVFGGALGLATCTIIFNQSFQEALDSGALAGLGRENMTAIQRTPIAITGLVPGSKERGVVMSAYMGAFGTELLMMLVVAAVAAVLSLLTYRKRPAPIIEAMVGHHHCDIQKELSGGLHRGRSARGGSRAGRHGGGEGDTERESASSVRSLVG